METLSGRKRDDRTKSILESDRKKPEQLDPTKPLGELLFRLEDDYRKLHKSTQNLDSKVSQSTKNIEDNTWNIGELSVSNIATSAQLERLMKRVEHLEQVVEAQRGRIAEVEAAYDGILKIRNDEMSEPAVSDDPTRFTTAPSSPGILTPASVSSSPALTTGNGPEVWIHQPGGWVRVSLHHAAPGQGNPGDDAQRD